jgi:hypothetical protein
MKQCISLVGFCAAMALCVPAAAQDTATELLPDMIVNPSYLGDVALVNNVELGRYHLRFSNATANIGDGPLYVYGVPPAKGAGDETQEVRQRIFFVDDTFADRTAGFFTFHDTHNHVHLNDWALYRLREVLPQEGIGEVVAEGDKTSFCLLDTAIYDDTLPNFPDGAQFRDCEFGVQGISVGFQDVYNRFLPDQWIDVTDVPNGQYWLESVVDPLDHMLEKDETNNAARILVTVDKPVPPPPDELNFFERLIEIIQRILELIFGLFGGTT